MDGRNGLSGPGVFGSSEEGTGVEGLAKAVTGVGVEGRTNGSLGTGVSGTGGFIGVDGIGKVGVRGTGSDVQQAGVKGEGHTGVWGITSTRDYAGVYGEHKGTKGIGTVGIGKGVDAGVLGRSPDGDGVRGEGKTGVYGTATSGYGGRFEGGKAQLMLKPGGSAGKPSGAHSKGEIYLDSAGTLFVCTASTTGTTAAKWRKLSTTAV